MRHHGFLAIGAALTVAASAWLLNQQSALDASEDNGSFREAFGDDDYVPVEDENGVRLNYFETTWDRVLRSVADQADLTLVMDKVPHGRYARRDRTSYRVDSAIRVLNADLEKQGFRLIQQAQHLIVLKLDKARTRYARPTLSDWQSSEQPQQQSANRSPFSQVSNRRNTNTTQVTWANPNGQAASPAADGNQMPPQPRQPFASSVKPQQQKAEESQPVDEGPVQQRTIGVRNAKASDVAKSIYLVFEDRAELVRNGLNGLPTFVVQEEASEDAEAGQPSETLFRIGIDQAANSLVVEATARRNGHLATLISELDKPTDAKAGTVKLVPNNGVKEVTAKELNDQIQRMVAMKANAPFAQAGQPAAQQNGQPFADGAGFPGLPQAQGMLNLRGEVNVQAIQDLGVIVLRGPEEDVAKVEAIIKQLEEISVGSLPGVHLLNLRYVNSEAMAALLTNVYDQLDTVKARGGDVRKTAAFLPVVQPNAVLILSSQIDRESILELADQLDKETDPGNEFRVFPLKNAIPSQVVTNIEAFYEEREGLGTRVRVVADARTNSIIVQGRTNDLNEIAKLIEGIDKDSPNSVQRMEIVELNHATAEELAETINNAIQSATNQAPQPTGTGQGGQGGFGAGQTNQDLQGTKSVALEFLAMTPGGRELVRSGILVDVRINADTRSNSLLVTAPEASMPLLLAMIEQLDRAPNAISEIKVFTLQNADAEQSVELLTNIFENQNQTDQIGVVVGGTEEGISSIIPVQFTADLRTNTVIAVGGAETLSVVEAILLRLDTTQGRTRDTRVIRIRNVQAEVVSGALIDFLDQQQQLQDGAEGLISNIERLRQETIIAPDNSSNTLIVSASPQSMPQIEEIIRQLDANPPEVQIQALIVEVQLDNTDEFGVELGFQDPTLFTRSLFDQIITETLPSGETVVRSEAAPGLNFNNGAALGNTPGTTPGRVGTQGLSNFSLGRQNDDLGFGGFVFSAQSDAVNLLVRALAARRTVQILSRPQVRTTHNQTALSEVGQTLQVPTGTTIVNNVVSPNTEERSVGIKLEVTPRVTQDGMVFMAVQAERSAISSATVPLFVDAATGNVVESPIIDQALVNTNIAVPNGQTVVIGGMISKQDETLERKVPWLGDLPLIGKGFRYDATTTTRSELLVFLTPRIIFNEVDAELIKQVETERTHVIESEAEELHGPLFSVPGNQMQADPGFDYIEPSQGGPMMDNFGPAQPIENAPATDGNKVVLPPQIQSGRNDSERSVDQVSGKMDRKSQQVTPASGEKRSWTDRLLRRG